MRSAWLIPILLLTAGAAQAQARDNGCAPPPPVPSTVFNDMPRGVKALALDGDTLRIEPDGYCIRLWALDAPEFKAATGPAARGAMDDLIAGQVVYCNDRRERSYGRMVASCVAGGKDLAEAMLRMGFAYTYRSFLDDSAQAKGYLAAEAEARQARRGLWAETVYSPNSWEAWPYAWQSLIGGLLAAFAAVAAVWETRRAAKKTIAAVDQQVAHEKQIYAETIKRSEDAAANAKWVGLVALQTELEACLQSIKAAKADLDSWSGKVIKYSDPFAALYIPREFDPNLTGLSNLGALFGKHGFRKLRDFRMTLALLTHPEINKPTDSVPVLAPFSTRTDIDTQEDYGFGMRWRNGALDRLIEAIAAGNRLSTKLTELITSLETDEDKSHVAASTTNRST